jgi:hypothetical protein
LVSMVPNLSRYPGERSLIKCQKKASNDYGMRKPYSTRTDLGNSKRTVLSGSTT